MHRRKLFSMRLLVLGSCAMFLCLPGYGQKELKADLLSLPQTTNTQVVPHLMALAEKTHEPGRPEVQIFAGDLVLFLGHAKLHDAEASQLVAEIDAVFKSAGTSTVGFLDHIVNFKTVLNTIGLPPGDAAKLGRELETIGRHVRGPDDNPVQFLPMKVRR